MVKLRVSNHKLMIETGRYTQTPHDHLPIVLVKVAYYASGSARFLPKLCSNYARFSNCATFLKNYSVHKLHNSQDKFENVFY